MNLSFLSVEIKIRGLQPTATLIKSKYNLSLKGDKMSTPKAVEKETSIVTMKNVMFMYSSVSRPVAQLNTDKKPPLTDHELEFHSFEIKILIDEDRYKEELKKPFKGAKNLPNVKEFTPEECKDKFDLEVEDDMVLIKFSQTCLVGKASKRRESFPIKQIGIKGQVQDMNGVPIDFDTQLGNGTMGHFQFRPVSGENGLYLYPNLLCITEHVEYVSNVEEDMESLGIEDLDDADLDKEGAEAAAGSEKVNAEEQLANDMTAPEGDDEESGENKPAF